MQSQVCSLEEVTYSHRVDNPDAYNYCQVPNGSADAFLFAGLAATLACVLAGHMPSLGPVTVLVGGAASGLLVFYTNLGHIGNAFTLFLGIEPPELLLYGFLPPLLLATALSLDWFVFIRIVNRTSLYGFGLVVLSIIISLPLMLYGIGLEAIGWKVIRRIV